MLFVNYKGKKVFLHNSLKCAEDKLKYKLRGLLC